MATANVDVPPAPSVISYLPHLPPLGIWTAIHAALANNASMTAAGESEVEEADEEMHESAEATPEELAAEELALEVPVTPTTSLSPLAIDASNPVGPLLAALLNDPVSQSSESDGDEDDELTDSDPNHVPVILLQQTPNVPGPQISAPDFMNLQAIATAQAIGAAYPPFTPTPGGGVISSFSFPIGAATLAEAQAVLDALNATHPIVHATLEQLPDPPNAPEGAGDTENAVLLPTLPAGFPITGMTPQAAANAVYAGIAAQITEFMASGGDLLPGADVQTITTALPLGSTSFPALLNLPPVLEEAFTSTLSLADFMRSRIPSRPHFNAVRYVDSLEKIDPATIPAEDNKCPHCWLPFGVTDEDDYVPDPSDHPEMAARQSAIHEMPFNEARPDNDPVRTPCGHIFGRGCLIESLEKVDTLCPSCRRELRRPRERNGVPAVPSMFQEDFDLVEDSLGLLMNQQENEVFGDEESP
jgi:hypothetical protein